MTGPHLKNTPSGRKMTYRSKTVIAIGFSASLVILAVIMAVWLKNISDHTQRLGHITNELVKAQHVLAMRDAAYRRAITLYRMGAIEDPFLRDDEYLLFKELK